MTLKAGSSRVLESRLISFWADALQCRYCGLPRYYEPQIRPVGKNYGVGGVVFVQINPGCAGKLTKEEVVEKYKRASDREMARLKRKNTDHLSRLQKAFLKDPCPSKWRRLIQAYNEAMRVVWGWPPGRYALMVERHGKSLDEIAIVNLMQCPVPGNKYSHKQIRDCWSKITGKLLQVLKPGIIVAQGATVYKHLEKLPLPNNVTLIRGVHHAWRGSKARKAEILAEAQKLI